jgi:Domain of unknown function DUF29
MTRPPNAIAYEEDFVAWLEDQARHARRREFAALDLENIAEELEGMARSDRREIRNRLIVLIIHLLKYQLQSSRRSRSWIATIGEQRRRMLAIVDDSPSLRELPASILGECYAEARSVATEEAGISERRVPEQCPFPIAAVLDRRWLTGRPLLRDR